MQAVCEVIMNLNVVFVVVVVFLSIYLILFCVAVVF